MTPERDLDEAGHGLRTPLEGIAARPLQPGEPIAAPLPSSEIGKP